MHSLKEQKAVLNQTDTTSSNSQTNVMKAESEYPDIAMASDKDGIIMKQEGEPCVEKKETLTYNNYEFERLAEFYRGETDGEIKRINDEAKKSGGAIKDVFIQPHIYNDGGPIMPASKETMDGYVKDYTKIMSNAGVSTKGVYFHYKTERADPCGECDGGYRIEVTITYTTCN